MTSVKGFALIETLIAVAAGLVLLGLSLALGHSLLRASGERSASAALAGDMARIAQATHAYLRDRPGDYPVGERKAVNLAALVDAGHLPAAFADRAGDGVARSPFGQPYAVTALRRQDGEPAAAVVYEQGAALPEKLRAVGLEADGPGILHAKESAAARMAEDYQASPATLLAASREARGPGGSYTLDLSAFLDTPPPEPALVALVDFGELKAAMDGPGASAVVVGGPKVKLWQSCRYEQRQIRKTDGAYWSTLGGCGPSAPDTCPDGPGTHWEGSTVVTDCRNGAAISMTPTGLAMTHGWTDTITTQQSQDPLHPIALYGYLIRRGSITLDNVTITQRLCATETIFLGSVIESWENPYHQAVGVCCSYKWDRPEPTCPPPPPGP